MEASVALQVALSLSGTNVLVAGQLPSSRAVSSERMMQKQQGRRRPGLGSHVWCFHAACWWQVCPLRCARVGIPGGKGHRGPPWALAIRWLPCLKPSSGFLLKLE